jgi:uncharacterized protein YcbK (DUF882 family)
LSQTGLLHRPCEAIRDTRRTRILSGTALAFAALLLMGRSTQDAAANGDTRTLDLYHVHTKERISVTFRRNGSFDHDALRQLNRFLRDWRNDEETTMSPRLFDIVWYVQREAGGSGAVHVMSAYRSPGTNEMLRRRSRAVAKESQHIQGNAMDVHIPGVSMGKVRELAMRLERGGVGYYPSAGSPFVHIDVGTVRSWPRMSRDQLELLFPDGKTVHLPRDGVPLANYQLALAEVRARGDNALDYDVITRSRGNTLWAMLFGGRGDDGGEDVDQPMRATTRVAARSTTQARGRTTASDVAALPAPTSADDVMRPGAITPAQTLAAPPARVEQVVRPQPGSEPPALATPAPASPTATPPAAAPIQVATLPIPPIRPRGLETLTQASADMPLPPIRPQGLDARAEVAALAAAATRNGLPEPSPQVVAGIPQPPLRPTLVASASAEAASGLIAPRLVQPAPARSEAAAVAATAAQPKPPDAHPLRDVLAGSRKQTQALDSSGLVQAFAALPPQRPPTANATVLFPRPPERPIATRKASETVTLKDAKPALAPELEAARRPDYVVRVPDPNVARELRSGVMASKLGTSAQQSPQSSFSGNFIRPMTPSFTSRGQ